MPMHPNQSDAVQNLQRYLRRLSFWESTIPDPPIDGIFESRTEAALREFQRLRGLSITGKADRETWDRLYNDYRGVLSAGAPPRQVAIFPADLPEYVAGPGSTGFAITVLQHMLLELHYNHKELADLTVTGIFDAPTEQAIRLFQSKYLLPVDGLVGLLTWNAITDRYNALFFKNDP